MYKTVLIVLLVLFVLGLIAEPVNAQPYVCAEGGGGGAVVANRPHHAEWETFRLHKVGDNKVALQAWNGMFVCAEGGGGGAVVANRRDRGGWETFSLHNLGGGKVALQAENGMYLCAEGGGGGAVVASRKELGPWETLELTDLGEGRVALRVPRASAQTGFPLNIQAGQKRDGGTSVDAFAKISRQSDKGLIEAKLWVRKSGISGEGFGIAQFVFLDKDGNTIHKSEEVRGGVGAVFPRGTNEKDFPKDMDVPLDKLNATRYVVVVLGVRDEGFGDQIKKAVESLWRAANEEFNKMLKELQGTKDEIIKEVKKEGMLFVLKMIVAQ